MTTAKTAISLDSKLLEATDKRAKDTGNSRSGVIAIALEKYFDDLKQQDMLEALNRVHDDNSVMTESEKITEAGLNYSVQAIIEDEQW